jgi:branched-chain amino acid transport system permease protein
MDPAGRFSTSYAQDRALVRTRQQVAVLIAAIVFLTIVPLLGSPRLMAFLTLLSITAVSVVGLQITMGYAGQINLGQSAFTGVGAYATGLLAARAGLPFWLVIPMAGLIAAAVGYVFGLSAVRIKGFYLALTTVAAQVLFPFIILALPSAWLGGPNGMSIPAATIGGLRITAESHFYLLSVVISILMVYGAFGIVRSRFGRAFMAVRDDELAAGMTGLPVARTKAFAFLIGAFYAGVAGSLVAYQLRFINFDQFTLFASVWLIAMVIVGGLGSIVGAIVGAALILAIQDTLTFMGPALVERLPALGHNVVYALMNVVLGALVALCLIYEPRGLMHRWRILKQMYRSWPFPY